MDGRRSSCGVRRHWRWTAIWSACAVLLAGTVWLAVAYAAGTGKGPGLARSKVSGEFCGASGGPRSPRGPAKVVLDKSTVPPGGGLSARIFNGTSRSLSTGLRPKVKRIGNGEATAVQIKEGGVPVSYSNVLYTYPPHSVTVCVGIPVSSEWEPGLYRVVMEVSIGSRAQERTRYLAAPFEVR